METKKQDRHIKRKHVKSEKSQNRESKKKQKENEINLIKGNRQQNIHVVHYRT